MQARLTCRIALLTLSWGFASQASAAPPTTHHSLVPCPFTAAEIRTALGLNVDEGEVADIKFPDSRDVACSYSVRNGLVRFTVRQTWDLPNNENTVAAPLGRGRRLRRIQGDADQAVWEETLDPEEPALKLTYFRGRVGTTLEIYGGMFAENAMRPLLMNLRRVP